MEGGNKYIFWVDTRILVFKILETVAVRRLQGSCFSDFGKQNSNTWESAVGS